MKYRLILILILILAGCTTSKPVGPSIDSNEKDTKTLLKQGVTFIKKRMPEKAVNDYLTPLAQICEKSTKIEGKRVRCAINKKESVYYNMIGAVDEVDTIVLEPTCAYGYYMMAYSYLELGMKDKAMESIKKAIELSPANSEFLSEYAYIYQIRKDWNKSLELYKQAEKMTEFSPDRYMVAQLGRALRGQGYSLIEMGKLDEAELLYKRCLKINRNDRKAFNELKYINKLRGK